MQSHLQSLLIQHHAPMSGQLSACDQTRGVQTAIQPISAMDATAAPPEKI